MAGRRVKGTPKGCRQDCLISNLGMLYDLAERRMARKLPKEVREPLTEAKRQLCLALTGFVRHLLEEDPEDTPSRQTGQTYPVRKARRGKSHPIKLD